jgi:N-formylglutamate amidohydrolase
VSALYRYHQGNSPLLISIPHAGTEVPDEIAKRFTSKALALPDTDWHVPVLYDFGRDLGASILEARFSRYVVDLNRPPDDDSLYPGQMTTGLCPDTLFDGTPLYQTGKSLPEGEIEYRRQSYWQPYHDQLGAALERTRDRYGYALLYDAHSIASRVPRLFSGRLPDLNLGTADGRSCASACERALAAVLAASGYAQVVNGRFVGGYITRHYGRPEEHWHAVQMEITQDSYMDEIEGFPYNESKDRRLQPVLENLLRVFTTSLD